MKIITLPFLLLSLFSFSQVTFSGFIVDKSDKKMKDVSINLYEGNEIVSKQQWSKKFKYDLDLEKYYVIELKKEGFVSKKIAISTFEGNKNAAPFMFVMEMVKEKKSGNKIDSDFPIALIEYKKSQGKFAFDSKYSRDQRKAAKISATIKQP